MMEEDIEKMNQQRFAVNVRAKKPVKNVDSRYGMSNKHDKHDKHDKLSQAGAYKVRKSPGNLNHSNNRETGDTRGKQDVDNLRIEQWLRDSVQSIDALSQLNDEVAQHDQTLVKPDLLCCRQAMRDQCMGMETEDHHRDYGGVQVMEPPRSRSDSLARELTRKKGTVRKVNRSREHMWETWNQMVSQLLQLFHV